MRRSILLIILVFLTATGSYARDVRDSLNENASLIDLPLVRSGLIDAGDIAIAPVRWNQAQWAAAFGVSGLTIGLVTQDL